MTTFRPRLDVLPAAQRRLWPALADVPEPFVLYGGTALALRLAHRTSVDFDFFAAEALDADELLALPFAGGAEVLQRQPDTLTISVQSEPPVKLSFFGGIDIGRVGHPERTDDGVLQVASMLDLFATKLKVLLQRVAVRDYVDLAATLRAGLRLEDGLGAAVALYGNAFPPVEAAKTLVCFEGDAASLAAMDRELLSRTVAEWNCTVPVVPKAAATSLGAQGPAVR